MRVTHLIKERLHSKRLALAGFCALAIVAGAGLGVAAKQVTSAATSRDCDTNSIDYKNMHGGCGAANPSELVADIKSNSPSDLKNIYAHYGLSSSQYSSFTDHAQMGTVYKDGRVVVGGQTVATDAWSVGRKNFSGRSKITISGKTYYTSPTSKSFAGNSIPAMVMFDKNGKMQYAVLTACGNPVTGHPKTPTYSCDDLQQKAVSGKDNTYSFTTKASAGNGAKITKVVYSFGDGSADVTKTSPTDAVTHTFTKTATVTVKVYVSVPGKQTVVVQSVKCSKKVTVTPPAPEMSCDQLKLTPGKADEQGNTEYTLAAAASVKNATINSYTFTFGDQQAKTVTTGATTASTTHTYAPGSYTAKVSVKVTANGQTKDITSDKCSAPITVKTPECKPGVPVGSPECAPAVMTCDELTLAPAGDADDKGNQAYKLSAKATATNATINSYTFTFGDQTQDSKVTSTATTASVTHTYAPGTYSAKVVVSMTTDGKTQDVTSTKCAAPLTVSKVPHCTVPGKENLPPNSPECQETCTGPNGQTYPKGSEQCETCTGPNGQTYPKGSEQCETCTSVSGQTYPKGSSECETCTAPNGQMYQKGAKECETQPQVLSAATELPNTGPGQVIAIFASASVLGVIAHRVFLRRRLNAQK
jgi:PKD domain